MRSSRQSFAVVAAFAAALMSGAGALHARDADTGSVTLAAAQTAKHTCTNTCRARYRDCMSRKQIPPFECKNVYQDCVNFTCSFMQ